MNISLLTPCLLFTLLSGVSTGQQSQRLPPTAPFGLGDAPLFTEANPWSQSREDLGRALFLDPILSSDRSRSCADCHQAKHGFSSPEPFPAGVEGHRAARHAPTLYNRALGQFQMWDGAETSLEKQVLGPIQNPLEMNLSLKVALERLQSHKTYPRFFRRAFGPIPITANQLGNALAIFVRTLTLGDSPIDRFQGGRDNNLTPQERAGLWIYESRGRCWKCHSGPNFTDESFHNTGIGSKDKRPAPGRAKVTNEVSDRGRFKTPTLRGVARSAPYMHDGSIQTLEEVVLFYNNGGRPNDNLSPHVQPLNLTKIERANLVAFLRALSRTGD